MHIYIYELKISLFFILNSKIPISRDFNFVDNFFIAIRFFIQMLFLPHNCFLSSLQKKKKKILNREIKHFKINSQKEKDMQALTTSSSSIPKLKQSSSNSSCAVELDSIQTNTM